MTPSSTIFATLTSLHDNTYYAAKRRCTLLRPRYPTSFTVRLIPGIYRQVPLPTGIDEDMAIEVVHGYAVEHGLSCAVLYPGLLSIWISADGALAHESHEPRLIIAGGKLTIGHRGHDLGVTTLRPHPSR